MRPSDLVGSRETGTPGQARAGTPYYIRRPFRQEPDFGATSVTYSLRDLLARGEAPS